MHPIRAIHPDFEHFLQLKPKACIEHFIDIRNFILALYPEANELLYHTHALTAVFSISEKLSDGFCMIPIYTNHLNLGFHKGTLLDDPSQVLKGTGKFIRHIPIASPTDYRNTTVETLLKNAIEFAISDLKKPSETTSKTISKIKK
ncbi:hypothetical protein KORDIASMS9_03645 [Kordia sp. SMS9]|uniref:DUF1801 domain-containing protein n=1 Tax=Kordia sp. SMS9 TaxID=2282170 RepID=UPI000E0CF949|nr:DUF1801 domain-containing protein [Kordia sp. SMS9]AXG71388.1 hypothetical protein KORDIASMS9_03645 [Kordia sp. SMS9]